MKKRELLIMGLCLVSSVSFGLEGGEVTLTPNDFTGNSGRSIANNIKEKVKNDSNQTGPWARAHSTFADEYIGSLKSNGLLGVLDGLEEDRKNNVVNANIISRSFSEIANKFVEDSELLGKKDKNVSRNARIFENRLLINELSEKMTEEHDDIMDDVTDLISEESIRIDENSSRIDFLDEKIDDNFDIVMDTLTDEIIKNQQDIKELGKELRKENNRGISQMAAMTSVDFGNLEVGELGIGAGLGSHSSSQSVALGVAYKPTENLYVNAKMAVTPESRLKKSTFGAGVVYKFKLKK